MKRLSLLLVLVLVLLPMTVGMTSNAQDNFKVVVIGKSVHPYWSNVEMGVRAAAKDLGLKDDQVIFWVPPTEDVAAQTQTMETYIAEGVTGIAIAPSDPNALEPVMKQAADAGNPSPANGAASGHIWCPAKAGRAKWQRVRDLNPCTSLERAVS